MNFFKLFKTSKPKKPKKTIDEKIDEKQVLLKKKYQAKIEVFFDKKLCCLDASKLSEAKSYFNSLVSNPHDGFEVSSDKLKKYTIVTLKTKKTIDRIESHINLNSPLNAESKDFLDSYVSEKKNEQTQNGMLIFSDTVYDGLAIEITDLLLDMSDSYSQEMHNFESRF